MLKRVVARASEYWLALIAFVVLLAAWEVAVRIAHIPPFVLPAPSAIWSKFLGDLALLRQHTLATVEEIVIGYAAAAVFGLTIAVLIVRFRSVERVLYPYIVASQTIPKVAVAPLLIIWLGAGLVPKVVIVAVTAFYGLTLFTDEKTLKERPEMLVKFLRGWLKGHQWTYQNINEATKLVLMTPRPGTIQRIVDIELPRPRDRRLKLTGEFMDYVRILHTELYTSMDAEA